MSDRKRPGRRWVLRSSAAAALAAIAGCSGGGGGGDGGDGGDDGDSGDGGGNGDGETTTAGGNGGGGGGGRLVEETGGSLSEGDGPGPQGATAVPYEFTVSPNTPVLFRMQAEGFDPLVRVEGPGGEVVAEPDDGGRNRRLNTQRPVLLEEGGTYTAWATSFSGSGTGSFTLEVVAGARDLGSITEGEVGVGAIDDSDPEPPTQGSVGEPVEFQAGGGQVIVTMRSGDFDPYVVIEGPGGEVVEEIDDGGGGFDSQGTVELDSGTHTLWATSFGGDSRGAYFVRVDET